MDNIRKIITYILMIALAFSLSITMIYNIGVKVLLNEDYIVNKMHEVDYYNQTQKDIVKNMQQYLEPSGIDLEVIEKAIDIEFIQKDINSIIRAIYENDEYSISEENVKEKISQAVYDNVKEKSIKLDVKQKDSIDKLIDEVSKFYGRNIFPTSVVTLLKNTVASVKAFDTKYKDVVHFLPICIVLVLIIINIKHIFTVCYIISISVTSAGVVYIAVFTSLIKKLNGYNITILNNNLSKVINLVIDEIIFKGQKIGIGMIIIGAICIVIFSIISVNVNYKINEKKKHQHTDYTRYKGK